MKVARPRDQGTRDKEGPVCSAQHQTEPVAPFVPKKTFPSQSTFSHLAFTPFYTHPPPPSYAFQAQCHSKSSTRSSPFSWSYSHLFSSCFPPVTCQYNVKEVEICPSSQHLNTQVVWASDIAGEEMCVYTVVVVS